MIEKLMCGELTSAEEKKEARRLHWYALASGLITVIIIAILSQAIKDVFDNASAAFNVFFSALIMLVSMTYCYVVYLVKIQIKEQFRRRGSEPDKK